MPAPPKVSISILNYQRRDTLRLALRHALAQEYEELQVLVVDNASTDGSPQMVEAEFPSVRLLRLPRNVGCAARNAGVAAASGQIVITIDNDVLLWEPSAVRTVVEVFATRPSLACLNFKILDADGDLCFRDWCHPRDWRRSADQEFVTDTVLEGASAFRREAFERAGGYWAPLFLGHEGLDLALRLIEAGHDLLYTPAVRVRHLVSTEARPSSRIYYTFTRNGVWVALRNHRPFAAAGSIAKDLALMAFSSARAGHWGSYFRGLRDGLAGSRGALDVRRPLRRDTYRRLQEIRSLQPSLLQKARRHWQERPI